MKNQSLKALLLGLFISLSYATPGQCDQKINIMPPGLNLLPDALKAADSPISDKRSLSTKEARQAAAKNTEAFLADLKEESSKAREELSAQKAKAESEAKELDRKHASTEDKEALTEKSELLGARQKLFSEIIETWKLIESSGELGLALLKANIEITTDFKRSSDAVTYYIDDLYAIEEEIFALGEKIRVTKSKREKVSRLVSSTQEKISVTKKELEQLLDKKNRALEADPTIENKYDLRTRNEILDLRINIANDTLKLLDLKLRRLNLEALHQSDEVFILHQKKRDAEELLNQAQERLFVSTKDFLNAQDKLEEQQKVATTQRESNKKLIDDKNKERIRLEENIERLEASLKTASPKELTNRSSFVSHYQAYLSMIRQKRALQETEHEIGKLELKNDFEEVKAFEKQFKLRNVEIRIGMKAPDFDVKQYLRLLKDERNLIESRIKEYDSKQYLEPDSDDAALRKSQIKTKISEIETKSEEFKGKNRDIDEIQKALESELDEIGKTSLSQNLNAYRSVLFEVSSRYKSLKNQYISLIKEIGEKIGEREIWTRSPRAISLEDLMSSMQDAEAFVVKIFWSTQEKISPSYLFGLFGKISFEQVLGLLITILLFFILYFLFRRFFTELRSRLGHLLMIKSGRTGSLPWTFLSGLLEFISEMFLFIFVWFFIHVTVSIKKFGILGFAPSQLDPYFITIFYLISIPLFLAFARNFLNHFSLINQRMSYFFFNEKSQYKNFLLASILLYSGAIILPLRTAFFYYGPLTTKFPAVLLAAFTLIAEVVVLLFFDKEDLLSIIPEMGRLTAFVKKLVEKYYYPVFFFLMTILIIYNPYVGYFNLAWKLALLVPLTVAIIAALMFLQDYLRKSILHIFIAEDDDGATDRFENATMLYGFIIVSIFFAVSLAGFFALSRMWGFPYTVEQLWESLSTKWVFEIEKNGATFGLVQIFQFVFVLMLGFTGSSLVNRFVLTKLFDVFKTEPGLENTISSISHYLIVFLFSVVGLSVIGLKNLVFPAFTLVAVGISLALKDQFSDIAGGFFILIERQFEIGHFVELPSEKIRGTVHKISFRSTVIRTARNFFIAIPNRIMISKPVTNWGMGKLAVGMELRVEVDYASDPEKVKEIVKKVLEDHHMILKVPSPVIRLDEFNDSGMQFYVRGYFTGKRVREIWNIASDVRMSILAAFSENGIEIPFPHRVLTMKGPAAKLDGGVKINILDEDVPPEENEKGQP